MAAMFENDDKLRGDAIKGLLQIDRNEIAMMAHYQNKANGDKKDDADDSVASIKSLFESLLKKTEKTQS